MTPVDYEFAFDKLRYSTGVAVQWLAPLGVFRFSYAVPLNEFKGNAVEYPTRRKVSSSRSARLSEVLPFHAHQDHPACFPDARCASRCRCAAAQAQTKIGVVNVARLLQEAPQAQAASQALENEFAARKRDLENQQRDLKAREDKLQKDGATMAEADRRNQEKTLRDGQRELARKQNEFMEDLNVRRNEALGQLQRTVLQEVQTYAKTAGLDLVDRRRALREPVDRHHRPGAVGAAGEGSRTREALIGSGSGRRGAARACQCAWPNWRYVSAANCAAIPTRRSSASRRCRTPAPGAISFLANSQVSTPPARHAGRGGGARRVHRRRLPDQRADRCQSVRHVRADRAGAVLRAPQARRAAIPVR